MTNTALFLPLLSMMILTMCVLFIMAGRRAKDVRQNGLDMAQLPNTRMARPTANIWSTRTQAAGDHVQNLFETPVLFYVVCITLTYLNQVNAITISLAWAYVAFRGLHAFIHLTYNLVAHRFVAFILSIISLIALISCFAIALI